MSDLQATDAAALAALLAAIRDPDSLLATWREKDLFLGDDNGLLLTLGPASSPDVQTVAQRYVAAVGEPLPPLLLAFLSAHDGYGIETSEDDGVSVVESSDLEVADGLLPARRLESDESGGGLSGILIGKAYDQARVILVEDGAVVFDDSDGDVILAPSLAAFFHALATSGLSIEAIASARFDR